jgi:hypothetical protein
MLYPKSQPTGRYSLSSLYICTPMILQCILYPKQELASAPERESGTIIQLKASDGANRQGDRNMHIRTAIRSCSPICLRPCHGSRVPLLALQWRRRCRSGMNALPHRFWSSPIDDADYDDEAQTLELARVLVHQN